jgi:hypothetical protein
MVSEDYKNVVLVNKKELTMAKKPYFSNENPLSIGIEEARRLIWE